MFQWLFERTLGRLLDTQIRRHLLFRKVVFGDPSRVSIHETALMNNALLNVMSGRIVVREHVFCGHNVCLLTGRHDIDAPLAERKVAIPADGGDIEVGPGVWLASNTTVLGPCTIGEMAVVAAGALVNRDVAAYTIVGGVPARVIGQVPRPGQAGPSAGA
jgi:acetyltransferase-like isoleucine patch superfamily enzyme